MATMWDDQEKGDGSTKEAQKKQIFSRAYRSRDDLGHNKKQINEVG